jgi:hypothetical protein
MFIHHCENVRQPSGWFMLEKLYYMYRIVINQHSI